MRPPRENRPERKGVRPIRSSNSNRAISQTLPAYICIFFVFAIAGAGCGKRRPPQPPVERVPQRTEALSGLQRGNQIILSWPAPLRNAPDTSVQSIRRVDVYRLAESPTAPLPLTEEEFATRSTLIGSVEYDIIRASTGTLTYVDTLELAGQQARLRYALRYVNASNQSAGFSNFLLIEPAARITREAVLTGLVESENAIAVNWRSPTQNLDSSTPVNLLGFNVYRVDNEASATGAAPLNSTLVTGETFSDRTFKFGNKYRYFVRAVSLGSNASQVESLDSNSLEVVPKDVYPPSAPTSITIAAAPGRLSLFFPANPEADVAGYIAYRSTDPNLPKDKWTRLNRELITRTTYQDDQVEPGQRYYYYLSAVDNVGNTSPPSEVISEVVP